MQIVMKTDEFYYRKLDVYHLSKRIVANVYALTKDFPAFEQHGLTNQIQRAAISVPSNIAEGMGRFSTRERIHFLEIALGSLMEVMCQLEIAEMLGYVSTNQREAMEQLILQATRMLTGLRKNIEERTSKKDIEERTSN